jgi:anti-sigma factor RsiW
MNTENIEEALWEYIDGISSSEERTAIEALLQKNMEWKSKYQELLQVHQLLHSTELDHPSMRFTQNVMEEITRHHVAPATSTYLNKNVIYGIGAFFLLMILGLLVYGMAQMDWSAAGPAQDLPIDFSKVAWSRLWNNAYTNIFMMVNVVLGLMLLDKYLARKKQQVPESGNRLL